MKVFIAVLTVTALLTACSQQTEKPVEDIIAAAPTMTDVVLDNEYVQAVVFTLKPGEKLSLHKGGSRVIYSLSDYIVKWTEGDQVHEKEWKKGNAHWHEAIDHAAENVGQTDAIYLVVTRKKNALPETGDYQVDLDASQADTDHATIILDNDNVRLIEVKIPAGEGQSSHQGVNRMIYTLTSYKISYTSDKMDDKESNVEAGHAHWHAADEHAVTNTGENEAHYLIFEFHK